MLIAEQLGAVGVATFPCAVRFDPEKNRWQKKPLTVEHEHWAETAKRPLSDQAVPWGGITVVGIPIPVGVVVLDGDWYKDGTSRQAAEVIFGCSIPWDEALIQTTIGGGEHYAFRLPDWSVRQGSNFGGSGVDTRTVGKGFICSGEGYTPAGMGCFRLAYPESLPVLPDGCKGTFEHVVTDHAPQALRTDDVDIDLVVAALSCIDPGCLRTPWVKIGMALRQHFHDDESTGYSIFDRWSAGEYWKDGCPANYDGEVMSHQWTSFKPEGGTSVGSLFWEAMRGGWVPPATFDTSMAFGAEAAPVAALTGILSLIHESGTDSSIVPDIIEAIRLGGFNEIQAGLLRGELKAALTSAKLLDKNLTAAIDRQIGGAVSTFSQYGKNHTENALIFIETNYPDEVILRIDQVWYVFDGKCWVEREDEDFEHEVTMAMVNSAPQTNTIEATVKMVGKIVHRLGVKMNATDIPVVVFQNGVLDLATGLVEPHSQSYYTTNILPYDYDNFATAPTWQRFLSEILDGDVELIKLLQEWLGYMIAPTYQYHKIMLLLGVRRGGKSIIGEIMHALVGSNNYTGTSLDSFAEDDALEAMQSKTVAFSGDTAKDTSRGMANKVIERLKKISGGDMVDFKRKFKKRGNCRLPTRITFAANHVPRLFDDSGALSHRFLVIPFDVSFADKEDPYLLGKLKAEMPGIAIWALEGLRRLNAQGRFTVPEKSKVELDFIRESYGSLEQFIDRCCRIGGQEVTRTADLYTAFRAWCLEQQEHSVMGKNTFVGAFREATRGKGCKYGVHRIENDTVRGFRGLSLKELESGHALAFKPEIVK